MTVSHARSAVCHPLGLRKAGGSLTTGLALAGLPHKDPALTKPIENIVEYATGHAASSHRMSTSRVWKVKALQLGLQGRWSKVHGPFSSAAATLLDFGWRIPEVDCWISPDGCQWDLEYQEQNFEGMLREVLGHHFQATLWQRARACDDGEVPDLTEIRALLRKGKKADDYRSLYWIDAVVQGAADTLF